MVVFRNITERKAAEESLRSSGERLKYLSSELLGTQEKERREIAKELHDSIGSSLSAVKFKASLIPLKTGNTTYAANYGNALAIPVQKTILSSTSNKESPNAKIQVVPL